MTEKKRRAKSFKGCTPCKASRRKCPEGIIVLVIAKLERPICSTCARLEIKCQYDLDSVLRFEQFTTVEDKETHRGPKAVQLRPRAQPRKKSDDNKDGPKQRRISSSFGSTTKMEMKVEEIIPEEEKVIFNEPLPLLKSPVTTEAVVDSLDSRYFGFFLSAMPQIIPYANFFSSIIDDIFARSVPHTPLRHSVLSISSMVVDYRLRRSMERFQIQYITSLHMIQNSISQMDVDEGVAIAVFLILWIDVVRAELRSARKHLRGLYLILQEIQTKHRPPDMDTGDIYKPGGMRVSPLIMQIWRIAIRLDFTTSLYLVEPPVFPCVPAAQQDLHRQWIVLSTPKSEVADWALAAFAQDNLIHRACHLAFQMRAIRGSSEYTPAHELEIMASVAELEEENRAWKLRPIVQIAESYEQAAQYVQCSMDGSDPHELTFLDYPPLYVVNSLYANLLNNSRAVAIYISLIAYPNIGHGPAPQRFMDAVEICRTLAALGEDKPHTAASKVWILFLAGVAFGGVRRSQAEARWILNKMSEIVRIFPLMKDAVAAYEKLWDAEGDFWEEMDTVQVIRK